jgi:hypothetical protein
MQMNFIYGGVRLCWLCKREAVFRTARERCFRCVLLRSVLSARSRRALSLQHVVRSFALFRYTACAWRGALKKISDSARLLRCNSLFRLRILHDL